VVLLVCWRCGHVSIEVELLLAVRRLVLEVAVVLSVIRTVNLTHHVLKVVELLVAWWLALGSSKLVLLPDVHLAESLGELAQLPLEIVSIAATELLKIGAVSAYHVSQRIEYLIGVKDLLVAKVCSVLVTRSNDHRIRRFLGERRETTFLLLVSRLSSLLIVFGAHIRPRFLPIRVSVSIS